eukprot:XP_020398703.1 uncharacterized protein LOC109941872 [Zea mays]
MDYATLAGVALEAGSGQPHQRRRPPLHRRIAGDSDHLCTNSDNDLRFERLASNSDHLRSRPATAARPTRPAVRRAPTRPQTPPRNHRSRTPAPANPARPQRPHPPHDPPHDPPSAASPNPAKVARASENPVLRTPPLRNQPSPARETSHRPPLLKLIRETSTHHPRVPPPRPAATSVKSLAQLLPSHTLHHLADAVMPASSCWAPDPR